MDTRFIDRQYVDPAQEHLSKHHADIIYYFHLVAAQAENHQLLDFDRKNLTGRGFIDLENIDTGNCDLIIPHQNKTIDFSNVRELSGPSNYALVRTPHALFFVNKIKNSHIMPKALNADETKAIDKIFSNSEIKNQNGDVTVYRLTPLAVDQLEKIVHFKDLMPASIGHYIFDHEFLILHFLKRFKEASLTPDKTGIENIHEIMSFYFAPIKESNEWQDFLKQQNPKGDKNITDKINLCAANILLFKLHATASQHDPRLVTEDRLKSNFLIKISNALYKIDNKDLPFLHNKDLKSEAFVHDENILNLLNQLNQQYGKDITEFNNSEKKREVITKNFNQVLLSLKDDISKREFKEKLKNLWPEIMAFSQNLMHLAKSLKNNQEWYDEVLKAIKGLSNDKKIKNYMTIVAQFIFNDFKTAFEKNEKHLEKIPFQRIFFREWKPYLSNINQYLSKEDINSSAYEWFNHAASHKEFYIENKLKSDKTAADQRHFFRYSKTIEKSFGSLSMDFSTESPASSEITSSHTEINTKLDESRDSSKGSGGDLPNLKKDKDPEKKLVRQKRFSRFITTSDNDMNSSQEKLNDKEKSTILKKSK